MFYAVYITTNGEEWGKPLCVFDTTLACKKHFIDWYSKVEYVDLSMRFVAVEIKELANDTLN